MDESRSISSLSLLVQNKISFFLNTPSSDDQLYWKVFVAEMQQLMPTEHWITPDLVAQLSIARNPGEALMRSWSIKNSYTVVNLLAILEKIGQQPLITLIHNEIANKMNPIRDQQKKEALKFQQDNDPISTKTGPTTKMTSESNNLIIVCLYTAKNEDFHSLKIVFDKNGIKLGNPITAKDFVHYQADIPKQNDQPVIRIYATHSSEHSTIESSTRISQMINEFNPNFLIMTGVCSGRRFVNDIALGDLLIATESFQTTRESTRSFKADVKLIEWTQGIMSDNLKWKSYPKAVIPSNKYQRDYILRAVYERRSGRDTWLKEHKYEGGYLADFFSKKQTLPRAKEELLDLCTKGSIVLDESDDEWRLSKQETDAMKKSLAIEGSTFPVMQATPMNPKTHFVKFSVNGKWENDIVGLDLESASVYSVCGKVLALVVKAVNDFEPSSSNDMTYFEFGNQLSAGYALELIKQLHTFGRTAQQ